MSECYVYVIGREEGPVKVGISSSPYGRMLTLQTGCPFKLEILHQRKMRNRNHALQHEATFHEVWRDKRLMGEWFEVEAELAVESVDTSLELEEYFESERRRGMQ